MTRRVTRRAFSGDLAALVGYIGLYCLSRPTHSSRHRRGASGFSS